MRISDTFRKAAGLFVQLDDSAPAAAPQGRALSDEEFRKAMNTPVPGAPTNAKTVEQIVREAPGPNLDEIKVPDAAAAQPLRPDGTVDFNAIYSLASVEGAPFTAEQLLELLATLPPELPLDARRQTVRITIQAMAKTVPVTPEVIVTDASRKLAALSAYEESYTKQANEFVASSESDIKSLEAQIEAKKAAITDAQQKQQSMNKACTDESDRLDDVLEFFSMDVAPSKYAKPGA